MTIRRVFFVALIHFAVMVFFPYYGQGGFSFGVMSCLLWAGGAILLGVLVTILGMENWKKLNALLTCVLLIACAVFLLQRFPQEDKVSPLKKLAYGDLPKQEDMKKGLSAFGINIGAAKEWVEDAKDGAKSLKRGDDKLDGALKRLE
ncbi:hypothetical protein Emin_0446 [Elusimicrobium minutum Pei191]|uniref:Uncharacterized protein n=1 Tax=Elusimicrobium minutum (strain Pei191) TaxID=445932 RepID=B2KBI1_ELUMP|nr:hypothetical protein [Elusimicrobium minutum]ACC98003.1 hypothetical protein Emin_0446 [Elusimicrobium minutum Pei191]